MIDTKALREKVLDLAIRGKLVPQDPNDEPASVLLERIREEKQCLVKEGKLKAKDIKNDTIIYKGEDNLHYEKFADGSIKCIEDEIPFELPEGWAWTRLGNLSAAIQYGLSNSAEPQGTHRLLRITDIQDGKVDWNTVPFTTTDAQDTYLLKAGDIVFARTGATVGKSFLITETPYPSVYASYLIRIRLLGDLPSEYLYQFFDSPCYWSQITDKSVGVGQPNCNGTSLKELFIPLPPINEQRKIIPTVQALLEYVATIDTNRKKLLSIIANTKAKILDHAIRGQLVPQNPDDEPASVLLERIRTEKEELIKQGKIKRDKKESIIFKGEDNSYYEKIGKSVSKIDDEIPFTLPNGWEWCKLSSLCSSIQYGLSNSAESSGTHKFLRITDIQNGSVNWETVPYTTTDDPETYMLKSDDIVFARTGATVGKSFLIDKLPYESVYASFLIRIRLIEGILPKYIYKFFNSSCYWEQITNKAVGVGQPNCNGTSLSNLFIPIPPGKVQNKIVALISDIFEHIDAIEKSLS